MEKLLKKHWIYMDLHGFYMFDTAEKSGGV
jgi:hypothetical protein